MTVRIHPTAIVDPSANLADGVTVGPYCIIGPKVTIGENTELRSHIIVESHSRVGRDNVVFQFSTLGGAPQDRKFLGEVTWCEIGDRNQIRESVTVHRGTGNGGGITKIGSDNLIMVGSHVAHDCVIGNHVTIANETMLAGHVHLGDWVGVGGGTGLHHYVTVGRLAFIAAMSRVERDVPPFMTVEGSPSRVRTANKILLERRGLAPESIRALRVGCKRIFSRRSQELGQSVVERVEATRAEFAEISEMHEFCDSVRLILTCEKGRVRDGLRPDDKRTAISRTAGATRIGEMPVG
ncbi:MAG: acyl-ACP--UDP-N-acetylglucosamine O-acyltransferase [Phycisphaerae bacterium]|nr:acyl-ACP--UDP-N-acetylglucosamine O-acyltransferase [Phycisphaerae bacterium]